MNLHCLHSFLRFSTQTFQLWIEPGYTRYAWAEVVTVHDKYVRCLWNSDRWLGIEVQFNKLQLSTTWKYKWIDMKSWFSSSWKCQSITHSNCSSDHHIILIWVIKIHQFKALVWMRFPLGGHKERARKPFAQSFDPHLFQKVNNFYLFNFPFDNVISALASISRLLHDGAGSDFLCTTVMW